MPEGTAQKGTKLADGDLHVLGTDDQVTSLGVHVGTTLSAVLAFVNSGNDQLAVNINANLNSDLAVLFDVLGADDDLVSLTVVDIPLNIHSESIVGASTAQAEGAHIAPGRDAVTGLHTAGPGAGCFGSASDDEELGIPVVHILLDLIDGQGELVGAVQNGLGQHASHELAVHGVENHLAVFLNQAVVIVELPLGQVVQVVVNIDHVSRIELYARLICIHLHAASTCGIGHLTAESEFAVETSEAEVVVVLLFGISILAESFATALAGSAVVESVFALPGFGSLMVSSALSRDMQLSGITILVISLMVSAVYSASETLQLILDPRVRRRNEEV